MTVFLIAEIQIRHAEIFTVDTVGKNTLRLSPHPTPNDDDGVAEFERGRFMELEVLGRDRYDVAGICCPRSYSNPRKTLE